MAARPCLAPFKVRGLNLALSFRALAHEGQHLSSHRERS